MTKELQLLKRSHYLTNLLHSHFAELRHVHLHPHMMKLYHDDLPAWPSIEFSPVDAAITSRRPLMKRGVHPALLDEAQRKRPKPSYTPPHSFITSHTLPSLTTLIKRTRANKTIDEYNRDLACLYRNLPQECRVKWPFDDPRWLSERDNLMDLIHEISSAVKQCNTMSAVRGAIKRYGKGEYCMKEDMYHQFDEGSKKYISNYKNREKEQKDVNCSWEEVIRLRDSLALGIRQLMSRYKASLPQQGWDPIPFELNKKDKKLICNHLILCLYTYHEPRRREYAVVRYYEGPLPSVTEPNYIHNARPTDKPVPKFDLVLRDYKTAPTEGVYIRECIPELNKALWDGFRLWPRKWLLTLDAETPMGDKNLSKAVTRLLPHITITMSKKMYVSKRYEGEKSWKDHAETAKHMGHSVQTQMQDYKVLTVKHG